MVEKTNKIPVDYNIKYNDFNKEYFTIKNFKLSTLKNACKKHHLKVTGNKSILFERLCTLFSRINASIKIQSLIRMHFSIIFVNKRGPGLLNRKLCNNQTDFITLEPLDEIPFEQFFSFKDNNNFIYGFNMISLMQNMKKTRAF